ncbi:MAG: VOC family protein [Filifactoraceae bacterium]
MQFKFAHNNINVLNLEKSIEFYKQALELEVVKEKEGTDGSFKLVYLGDGVTSHSLELTYLKEWEQPYNLGDNEFHIAFSVDDFDAAYEKHKKMGCICFENPQMGIYFIIDPDGYWIEIIPSR